MHDDQELDLALQSGDFETAKLLAIEYGRAVRAELQAAASLQSQELIFRGALERLNNHLYLARVLRAHIAADFAANSGQCLYQGAAPDLHCWNLEA